MNGDHGQPGLRIGARDGRPALDLGRDVHALCGLVFDALTLDETLQRMREAVAQRRRCFLSTVNVSFAAAARDDVEFRRAALQSDLVVADGAPLVRLARWMGLPLRERVAGSDLFDRLRQASPQAALAVYFFGGDDGVAQAACEAVNAERGGVRCVGLAAPGFGTLESMSDDATIAAINDAAPDFVMLSIGARKGQAWILRNRERLHAPLLSYFGAVVNFVAGRVERAPAWMRRAGLEWLWRIRQEPALWRRYWQDGRMLLGWLLGRLGPWWRLARVQRAVEPARCEHDGASLALHGAWTDQDLPSLRHALAARLAADDAVRMRLDALQDASAGLLGLLAIVDAWQQSPRLVDTPFERLSPRVRDRVRLHGMEHLFDIGAARR